MKSYILHKPVANTFNNKKLHYIYTFSECIFQIRAPGAPTAAEAAFSSDTDP